MTTTWDRDDAWTRYSLLAGFILFVLGTGVAAYCGYTEVYEGEEQPDVVKFAGWVLVIAGLVWFLLGLFQSPWRRR